MTPEPEVLMRWMVGGVVLAMASRAEAFCTEEWWVFGCDEDEGHGEATAYLDFLRPEIYDEVLRRNYEQDDGSSGGDPFRHFDACQFGASAEHVQNRHDDVIDALDPSAPLPFEAAHQLGRLLHPLQDFYAHANLPELLSNEDPTDWDYVVPENLLDGGPGAFRDLDRFAPWNADDPGTDILFGELESYGEMPDGWTGESLDDDSAVPTVIDPDGLTWRVLATGWQDEEADGRCLDVREGWDTTWEYGLQSGRTTRLVHGDTLNPQHPERPCDLDYPTSVCLNHDWPGRPYYEQAVTLAGWQTEAEWCRMLHLSRDSEHGLAASSVLMTLFADIASPTGPFQPHHPTHTACAPAEPGPVEIRVQATWSAGYPVTPWTVGGRNVLAIYTDDFGQSDAVELDLPLFAPSAGPVSLCVDDDDVVAATLWGWMDEGVFQLDLGIGDFGPEDVVLRGATAVVSDEGLVEASGEDLDVVFEVERDVTDEDGDGLSICAEAFHGTTDALSDTDADGLPDGEEVEVGADPLDPDTDGDGLLDGDEMWIHGTDPRFVDTDDDGAWDGLELDLGTAPLIADTDRDGLLDGFDPGELVRLVEALPDTAFRDPRTAPAARLAMIAGLERAEGQVARDPAGALASLTTVRAAGPGCVVGRADPTPLCAALTSLEGNLAGG